MYVQKKEIFLPNTAMLQGFKEVGAELGAWENFKLQI